MGRMISIQMDSDDMIEALIERVGSWTNDSDVIELFEQYYENAVENGCFDGCEFNVMSIVDNDYVNNTSVITRSEYEEKREEFLKDSIRKYIEENKQCYSENEHEEWVADLKAHIEDLKEDLKEEAPEWDDIECGEPETDLIEGSYVEAKTDSCLLVSW
jgi:hypothetical protein